MHFFTFFVLGLLVHFSKSKHPLQEEIITACNQNNQFVLSKADDYFSEHTLNLHNIHDCSINFAGSLLLKGGKAQEKALDIQYSSQLTIENLNIDYNPLRFTQGVVTRIVNDNTKQLEITINQGYPTDIDLFTPEKCFMQFYEVKNNAYQFKQEALTFTNSLMTSINFVSNIMTVTFHNGAFLGFVAVNDLVTVGDSGSFQPAINIFGGKQITLKSINIYSSPSAGILDNDSSDTTVQNIDIKPGVAPANSQTARLMSVNRDGIHFNGGNGITRIQNSRISFCGDDAINVKSAFGKILNIITSSKKIEYEGHLYFGVDEELTFYSSTGKKREGARKITSKGHHYVILENIGGLEKDDLFLSKTRNTDFKIENNVITDIDARGILASGSKVSITNNEIHRTTMGGIWTGIEITDFVEADFLNDVTISGNTLTYIGYTLRGRIDYNAIIAAIFVGNVYNKNDINSFKDTNNNEAIIIENNEITNTGLAALFIGDSHSVTVQSNTMENIHYLVPNQGGSYWGLQSFKESIVVYRSYDINFIANTISVGEEGALSIKCESSDVAFSSNSVNSCST